MKKISIIILATLGFSMIFSACKKYEEGPALTLRTPKQRVVGTWNLTETRYNNVKIDFNNLQDFFNSFDLGGLDLSNALDSTTFDLSQLSLKSIKLNLDKEGNGAISIELAYGMLQFPYSQEITWSFDDKKDALIFKIKDVAEEQSFKILKLTKDELWLEKTDVNNGVASIVNFEFEKIKD
jgi:hypothetical protein